MNILTDIIEEKELLIVLVRKNSHHLVVYDPIESKYSSLIDGGSFKLWDYQYTNYILCLDFWILNNANASDIQIMPILPLLLVQKIINEQKIKFLK